MLAFAGLDNAGLQKHVQDRLAMGANLIIVVWGGTGKGKSSIAITLGNWLKGIQADQLLKRLAWDYHEFRMNLAQLETGDWIILDESLKQAGTGSKTEQEQFQNASENLRKSGIHAMLLSPTKIESAVANLQLEVLLVNREKKASRCMVWGEDGPLCMVELAWCPEPLYKVYEPWKDANVEKTKRSAFRSTGKIARLAVQTMKNERFRRRLLKYKKIQLNRIKLCFHQFNETNMVDDEAEQVCDFIFETLTGGPEFLQGFEEDFGFPTEGVFDELVKKHYKE
jgi:hypothetical protein